MKSLLLSLALILVPSALHAEDPAAKLEREVAALVAGPQVTVVHFWAPWCPNCREEMRPEGWAKFIGANPTVKVVFLNIWHKGQDPASKLAAGGLGAQPNLLLLTHPNPARVEADRLKSFLGLPLTWIPATWVFRGGKLCVAFNYGEMRFSVLQQMVDDARESWDR